MLVSKKIRCLHDELVLNESIIESQFLQKPGVIQMKIIIHSVIGKALNKKTPSSLKFLLQLQKEFFVLILFRIKFPQGKPQ